MSSLKSWADASDSPPASPNLSPAKAPVAGAWSRSSASSSDAPASTEGESADATPAVPAAPATRPRLQLQKRSVTASTTTTAPSSASSSIFGAARSREQVLAEKGIDVAAVEAKIEKKSQVLKLTKTQEEDADALKSELLYAEKALTDANEKELPEGNLREKVEAKKTELKELLDGFAVLNLEKAKKTETEIKDSLAGGGGKDGKGRFERPSERRKRQEQEARDKGEEGGDGERRTRGGSGNNQDRQRGGGEYERRDGGSSRSYNSSNNRDRDGGGDRQRRDGGGDRDGGEFGNFGNRGGGRQGGGGDGGSYARKERSQGETF